MKLLNNHQNIILTFITLISLNLILANPLQQQQQQQDDNVDNLLLDTNSLKSILLYNRLQKLIENEPEIIDLFDLDHGQIQRIIDELLIQTKLNNQIRVRKFLNVKSNKRAAAMGVDLPDYILHINKGKNFDFSSFREKMQKSG